MMDLCDTGQLANIIARIETLELSEKRSFRYTDAYVEGLWTKVHEIAERVEAVEDEIEDNVGFDIEAVNGRVDELKEEISKLKSHRLDLPVAPSK